MAAAKTTSTVKTLQAPKKVTAKTATAKRATGKGLRAESEGDALDVLRLFIKTYANL
jgi:hypothetical protein